MAQTTKPAPTPGIESTAWQPLCSLGSIIAKGDGIDWVQLTVAVQASMSEATSGHCVEAFKAITLALREAKLLLAKKAPPKAPTAPEPTADAVPAK